MGDDALLQIRLLGPFQVTVAGRAIESAAWRQRRAAALLKLLALAPSHRLHREQLMDALWPEHDAEAAGNNLRVTLHAARRLLGQDAWLRRDGELIELAPAERIRVDVDAFEAAVVRAWQVDDPRVSQEAADLYTGDLLPDDPYEDWVDSRRTALRASYLTLLGRLAELWEQRGELGQAIATRQRQLALEPADEASSRTVMRLYAQTGRSRLALAQYESLRAVLAAELGAEPEHGTTELYQKIRSGKFAESIQPLSPAAADLGVQPAPAVQERSRPSPAPTPTVSPLVLDEVVGRDRELAEVKTLLARSRLINVTGPGGVGKTRLALAVAQEQSLRERFGDGVVFVSLAEVQDYRLVTSMIAQSLGIQGIGERGLLSSLVTTLRESPHLLVLDNFEHVVEAAPVIAELLAACPALTVLVTSRARLRLHGEREYSLGPLPLPAPAPEGAVEPAESAPAVLLFLRRLEAVRPGLSIAAEQIEIAGDICRRLDGLPLAIELAAARGAVLSLPDLRARLADPLALLTGGSRDSPERQRTLRNAIAWSYDLLTPAEQRLLRRLAVFAGGWTLESAEAVVDPAWRSEIDILDGHWSLVEKSLIRREEEPDGTLRFVMLDTIHEFVLEQLERAGEADAARRRHAAYFLELAERIRPQVRAASLRRGESSSGLVVEPEFKQGMQRLESETANFRLAFDWWVETATEQNRHAEAALRLATALSLRSWLSSPRAEGFSWFERGLAAPGSVAPGVRVQAVQRAAGMAVSLGEYDVAERMVEQARALSETLGDVDGLVVAITLLGRLAVFKGAEQQARDLLTEADALEPRLRDAQAVIELVTLRAFVAILRGQVGLAVACFEDVLARQQQQGGNLFLGTTLAALGLINLAFGDLPRAEGLLREALSLDSEFTDLFRTHLCLIGLAGLAATRGAPRRAARLWGAAERYAELHELRLLPIVRDHAIYAGLTADARRQLGEEAYRAAWSDGRALRTAEAIDYALAEPTAD